MFDSVKFRHSGAPYREMSEEVKKKQSNPEQIKDHPPTVLFLQIPSSPSGRARVSIVLYRTLGDAEGYRLYDYRTRGGEHVH